MLLNQQVCGDADGEIEIFKFQFILTFSYCGKKKIQVVLQCHFTLYTYFSSKLRLLHVFNVLFTSLWQSCIVAFCAISEYNFS